MYDTLSSGLLCSISCLRRQVSFASLPRRFARKCISAWHVLFVPLSSQVSLSYPSLLMRCFVTIPSEIPKRKLTVCCVLDEAERVVLFHFVTPRLVLWHVWCCPAQSLFAYMWTNGGNLSISIEQVAPGTPFSSLAMRFTFILSLSVGHVIFLAVSFTLCVMSARPWNMHSRFPTAVLYTARFWFSSSICDSVVGCPLRAWSRHGSRVFQTEHENHVSDILQICLNRMSASRSPNHSAEKEDFFTQFLHSSHDPHEELICQTLN